MSEGKDLQRCMATHSKASFSLLLGKVIANFIIILPGMRIDFHSRSQASERSFVSPYCFHAVNVEDLYEL